MKFRVIHNYYYPTYFKTKKEAIAYQEQNGGTLQRKIGYEWRSY